MTGANAGWTVRRSSDGGDSWSSIAAPGLRPSCAKAVLSHATAGILVAGYVTLTSGTGKKTTSQQYWYVQRSLDGGATWSTVDACAGGTASAMTTDSFGNIYVAGANAGHWIVRKSSNGGTSWATVDDFVPPCVTVSTHPLRSQCFRAQALNVAGDGRGNMFVAGWTQSIQGDQWLVRMNLAGTSTWQTVDTFQYLTGQSATAYGITSDGFGNIFVGGSGGDGAGTHWLVRKLTAP